MRNNLKNALPFIAGALASKQGVKVLQGDWAKTNCVDTIWLPPLPDDDPNVRVKALGFVGHETAHISFTDNEPGYLARKQKNPDTFFGIMNLLEDIRIEKLQKTRFPGVSDNLDKLVGIMVEEKMFVAPKEESQPVAIMQGWILAKLRHDLLNQRAIQPVMEAADVVFEKMLPQNTRIRLEALAFDVENATSTMDVFNLTREIMQMIEEEAKKEEEKEQEQEQAKQQQQAQQQPDPNQTSNAKQSQGGDTQDDDASGSSASGKDGDDSDDAGDSTAQGQGDADDSDGNPASGAGGELSDDQVQKMSEVLQGILGAGKGDQYEDIGDVLANQINQIKTQAATEDYDGSGPMRVFNAVKRESKGRNAGYDFEARRAVNALKLKLHTMLQSQTLSSSLRSDRGARFSPRHLHEVAIGGKVFEKRTEGIDIDLAAGFLIDISGSMTQDNKLKIAALSGYATAEALASVHGVTTSVAVFPTENGVDYISPFGVKPITNAENFNSLTHYGDTPLSDAMARVSIDLLQQQKERKILFVITDGEPNYNDQSATVIEAAANAGIEIMGVGIGVKLDHLFTTWCSIDSVDDLPGAMFGMLHNKLSLKKADKRQGC